MKPDFNVYLDGTRLDGETKGAVSGVRVFLTHSGASAFEIVVDDPELRWQAKPTFTECKEVQIELGVPGKMKKVFDGEVTAWRTELERNGPTVLVLRGMDRSHRLMRGHKTKTYAEASPLDCARQIASAAGLTAKTAAGQPAPVKTFRLQANESDFSFLRKMADLEGYLFYVDGSDLHFERPKLSSKDDLTVTFGEDVKTFLPVANFRRPAAKVEVGGWDSAGKAALTGKAKPGDEMWSVPGGKPGAEVARFQGTKASVGIVESQVATQEHADTVARAALTKRSLEFLTAEVEVQGNPEIKPGAMINVKKVGVYSGHYLVTEANHFYDAAGYNCIFYVARDKWGDSSSDEEKKKRDEEQKKQGKGGAEKPYKPPPAPPKKPPPDQSIDFTLQDDEGKPFANVKCKIKLKSGEVLAAETDADGHVHLDQKPEGPYTVEITGDALELSSIDPAVEDPEGAPPIGAAGGGASSGSETKGGAGEGGGSEGRDGGGAQQQQMSGVASDGASSGPDAKGSAREERGAEQREADATGGGASSSTETKGSGGEGDGSAQREAGSTSGSTAGSADAKGATGAPTSAAPESESVKPVSGGKETRAAAGPARAAAAADVPGRTPGATDAPVAGRPAVAVEATVSTGPRSGTGGPARTAPPGQAAPGPAAAGSAPATAVPAPAPRAAPEGPSPAGPTTPAAAAAPAPSPAPAGSASHPPVPSGAAAPAPAPSAPAAAPAAPSSAAAAAPAAGGAAPGAPASSGNAPLPSEGLSPVEIGGIGASVAAVGAVSAGIATLAGGVESVKATAASAAESRKPADSENVEE